MKPLTRPQSTLFEWEQIFTKGPFFRFQFGISGCLIPHPISVTTSGLWEVSIVRLWHISWCGSGQWFSVMTMEKWALGHRHPWGEVVFCTVYHPSQVVHMQGLARGMLGARALCSKLGVPIFKWDSQWGSQSLNPTPTPRERFSPSSGEML